MVGRLVGTLAASALLIVVSADQLVLLIGVFILSGVGMSISGLRFDPIRPVLVVAGMLSGLLGTVASVGGPPMALVYQHAAGARIRSTMSGFFLLGSNLGGKTAYASTDTPSSILTRKNSAFGRFSFANLHRSL